MSPRRAPQLDPLDVALGEVAPGLQDEAARRLREDDRFRAEVERLAPVVARLERQPAETWRAPEPPPLVVGAPMPVREPRGARRRARRFAFVLRPAVALGVSLVLVAGGVVAGLTLGGGDPADDGAAEVRRFALGALPGHTGRATVIEHRDGRVTVKAAGLQPDRAGHHELWLLPKDGDPVPVGTFKVDPSGHATATYALPDDPERYALLDVSEEPADGDPKHSGRSVLQAPVSASPS